MRIKILRIGLLLILLFVSGREILAQNQQLFTSQQFRLAERIIRIAEPGELSDSLNIWGDVGSPGRYIVPKGTTIPELLSYAFGPNTLQDGQTNLDWSKMRVEINIQETDNEESTVTNIKKFKYRFEEPFPVGINDFILKSGYTVTVRVKRKPAFRDYVLVIAPVISAVATTITTAILIADRNK